jgi:hypothetical protein
MSERYFSDKGFAWRPKRLYIPIQQFSGLQVQATMKGGAAGTAIGYDSDAANWKVTKAAATDRKSVNVAYQAQLGAVADPATTKIVQLTGMNVTGMIMTTAADEAQHYLLLPFDFDPQKPVSFYVWWTCEAAAVGARDITWRVRYTSIIANTTALIASPATTLSRAIAAQAPLGTSLTIQRTTEALSGQVAPNTIPETTSALQLRVDMQAFNAALSENKYLLGLEMAYSPRRLRGPDGMAYPAKMNTPPFAKHY